MTDYIIVGCGLAGIAFAETALQNKKSVLVFNDRSHNASEVAGGLFNPVNVKRYGALQNAREQIGLLQTFYSDIEAKLNVKVKFDLPILRKFFSIEEQNNWFTASDKPGLTEFLSQRIVSKNYSGISAPFGYGEVLHTGYVDTQKLLLEYRDYLRKNNLLVEESFNYSEVQFANNEIHYKDIQAKNILFAEGFGLHSNRFFKELPLNGTKGELFVIKASGLSLDVILNTNVFILPLGNDLFKVGATYEWEDKTSIPTEKGKQELLSRIREVLECDFEIIEHLAGVRPTTKDRRPLLGTHPEHHNVHILNGLGTRGVMLGPYMADKLFRYIEYGTPIERENNISRFAS